MSSATDIDPIDRVGPEHERPQDARTAGDQPDFVATGPGTIAGRYLRQFWQPVLLSREVARGQVLPVRVMSEDFVVYRDEEGRAHVTASRCRHRGTLLTTGIVRGEDIVCRYHGWRYAPNGACVDQPAEPKPFCNKVRLQTYPTHEGTGLIFGYFGSSAPPPPPEWPEVGDFPYRHRIDCNFFQSAENVIDDVHVPFVHSSSQLRSSTRMAVPRVGAQETEFGLTQELHHTRSIEHNHFIMPNLCYVVDQHRGGLAFRLLMAYVPIDDISHNHFFSLSTEPRFVSKLIKGWTYAVDRFKRNPDDWFSAAVGNLSSPGRMPACRKPTLGIVTILTPHQGWRLDEFVGQGAVADRSREQLGQTDVAVILLRKLWRRELARLAAGDPIKQYQRPRAFPPRCVLA